jgi:hypothetical protein
VIQCKRIKGGRAGCWINLRGKRVFRFAPLSYLSGLGIPIVGAGKLLPGFTGAGKRKRKKTTKSTKRRSTLGRSRSTGRMRTGCKTLRNGRRACYTKKGFRIIG